MSHERRAMRHRRGVAFCVVSALVCGGRAAGDEARPRFDAEHFLRRAATAFKAADRDGDAQVTRDEFHASYQAGDREERMRRFDEFDVNDDGQLNRDEFPKLLSPTDDRVGVPDPMLELEEASLAKWQAAFAAADHDGDGALSSEEWPQEQIANEIQEVAGVDFRQWDKNRDGKVDAAEGKWLLAVAYGLAQLDGRPIRTDTGRVFSWYYFRAVDRDRDGRLSRDEFVTQFYEGPKKSAAIFAQLDADGDGLLTAEETRTLLWHDTLALFFIFDRNFDGFMTTDEFLRIGWGRQLALRSVRAFDVDGDGRLSYYEFRRTTFANQASDWARLRQDSDGDGRLSFAEFYIESPPLLIAQSRWFFDRFDANHDGHLSLGELEFDVGLDKVPPGELFAARDIDGDGRLLLTEIFSEPKPPDSDAAARDRYEMRLAAEENRFMQNDKDGSGDLDLAEFTESQRAAVEAARRQNKVLSDRQTMLEGNYYVRKSVLIVNEIAFLAIVWWVVRKTGGDETRRQGDKATRRQGASEE